MFEINLQILIFSSLFKFFFYMCGWKQATYYRCESTHAVNSFLGLKQERVVLFRRLVLEGEIYESPYTRWWDSHVCAPRNENPEYFFTKIWAQGSSAFLLSGRKSHSECPLLGKRWKSIGKTATVSLLYDSPYFLLNKVRKSALASL